jgi:hypothetical protein
MTGTRLRWRTETGIRAGSSEMPVEPPRYTTACVLLKQPDKQKTPSKGSGPSRRLFAEADSDRQVMDRYLPLPRTLILGLCIHFYEDITFA